MKKDQKLKNKQELQKSPEKQVALKRRLNGSHGWGSSAHIEMNPQNKRNLEGTHLIQLCKVLWLSNIPPWGISGRRAYAL